jgi:hypothetical protein
MRASNNSNNNNNNNALDLYDRSPSSLKNHNKKYKPNSYNMYKKSSTSNNQPLTNVKEALENAAFNAQSAAKAASNGLSSQFTSVAEKGTSLLANTAAVTSGVSWVAERGSDDLLMTTRRAQILAKKGTRDANRIANRSVSDIQSFAKRGSTQAEEVVKWIDSQAKSGTEYMGSQTKSLVLRFTGKEEYSFGDVTKEVLRRIASQEVNIQDTILLLKILLVVGGSFGYLAESVPFAVLLEALNVSMESKIGGKIVDALALSLDDRLVAAFSTNDTKFQLGEAVKRSLLSGIIAFTGKDRYESGDIQRKVRQEQQKEQQQQQPQSATSTTNNNNYALNTQVTHQQSQPTTQNRLDLQIGSEFEEWDKKFRESRAVEDEITEHKTMSAKTMDMKIASELETEWDYLAW